MRPTWLSRSARRERLPNHGRTSRERAAAVPYTRRPRLTEGPGTHPPPGPPREPKRPPRPRPLSPLERQRFPLVLTRRKAPPRRCTSARRGPAPTAPPHSQYPASNTAPTPGARDAAAPHASQTRAAAPGSAGGVNPGCPGAAIRRPDAPPAPVCPACRGPRPPPSGLRQPPDTRPVPGLGSRRPTPPKFSREYGSPVQNIPLPLPHGALKPEQWSPHQPPLSSEKQTPETRLVGASQQTLARLALALPRR